MKFEIGKSYTFKNFSTEEILTLQKGDDMATENRIWAKGTWSFTIENEDQQPLIQILNIYPKKGGVG